MNPWPVAEEIPEVHLPRPGHADLVGTWKYGQTDVRNILERASARETAARVAGGALAKAFLRALGVEVRSHVVQIASVRAPAREGAAARRGLRRGGRLPGALPGRRGHARDGRRDRRAAQAPTSRSAASSRCSPSGPRPASARTSPGRSASTGASRRRSSRSRRSRASPIGDGFEVAGVPGSQAHDEIFYSPERGFYRETNRAGGLEGGMTTGEPLVVRGAMKPLPTLTKPLRSVDIATLEPAEALRERTDSCTVPAAGRRRRGDGRAGAGRRLPAQVRRRPHRRRARGAARLRGADRLAPLSADVCGGDEAWRR